MACLGGLDRGTPRRSRRRGFWGAFLCNTFIRSARERRFLLVRMIVRQARVGAEHIATRHSWRVRRRRRLRKPTKQREAAIAGTDGIGDADYVGVISRKVALGHCIDTHKQSVRKDQSSAGMHRSLSLATEGLRVCLLPVFRSRNISPDSERRNPSAGNQQPTNAAVKPRPVATPIATAVPCELMSRIDASTAGAAAGMVELMAPSIRLPICQRSLAASTVESTPSTAIGTADSWYPPDSSPPNGRGGDPRFAL